MKNLPLLKAFVTSLALCAVLVGCDNKTQENTSELSIDSVVVTDPPVPVAPSDSQTVQADTITTQAVVEDTVTQPEEVASRLLLEKTFEGAIEGFKSQAFAFTLPQDARVSIRVQDKKQAVFKLYHKTGELDETIVKEDVNHWKGELAAGEYQLKVFLPLKQAAKKKRSDFKIAMQARRI